MSSKNNKEGHTRQIQTLNNDLVVRFRWFTKELVPTPTLSTDHSPLHVTQADIRQIPRHVIHVTQPDIRPTISHVIHVTQPDIRPTTRHVTAHQATMIHVLALQAFSPNIRQDLAETLGDK